MPIRRLDDFADTCVFNKQSLGPILCDPPRLHQLRLHLLRAPLLPKLRGHFAEFLDQDSLERLRLLASPTCVGFRYGRADPSSAKLFSAVRLRSLGGGRSPLRHRISAIQGDLPPRKRLPPCIGLHCPTDLSPLRPSATSNRTSPVRESLPVSHRLRLSASP